MGTIVFLLFFGLPMLWLLAWPIRIMFRGGIAHVLGGSGLLVAEICTGWLILKVVGSSISVAPNPLEAEALYQQDQQFRARVDAYNALLKPPAAGPPKSEADSPPRQTPRAAQETHSEVPEHLSTKP